MKIFSDLIKDSREKLGLTQAELANRLGVSKATVYNWENGRQIPPSDKLFEITELAGTPLIQKNETISNASKNDSELHKLFADCLKVAEAFNLTEYLKQVLIDTKKEIAKKGLE
jgi:transcriptional regulator with XRE-family HTH domain